MQEIAACKVRVIAWTEPKLFAFKWKFSKQTQRIMKLFTFLMLAAVLQVSAEGFAQEKISISVNNAPLEQVINSIKKQSGFYFIYRPEMVAGKTISIHLTNATLKDALDQCLKPQKLVYNIVGNSIVISTAPTNKVVIYEKSEVNNTPIDVKGRVVNEKGEPVLASVTVKGSTKGTSTNKEGWFVLVGIEENAILIISGVGIETTEVKAEGKTQLEIAVKISVRPLDEVQMIAYGTTTKRFSTGNITSVKAADIEMQPVQNPLLALEGRVPGVVITQNSGVPGGGVTVRIQGQNSILAGSDPLYVVDGIPFASQSLVTTTGGFTPSILGSSGASAIASGGKGNPLSYINPNDIESIEILKDADATSIYGSRGANGVILITTKKGKPGRTKLDIDMQTGWGKITRKLDLMNTRQYLEMRNEALYNDGLTPDPTSDYDLTLWDTTRYTDWQKVFIGGTAKYTNSNVSISGGNATTQYLIGGTYHRETTVFPGSFDDHKGSLHFSLNSVSDNKKLSIQLTGSYLADNNQLPQIDFVNYAYNLAPDAPSLYNPDGTFNWAPDLSGISSWANPMALINNKYQNKTDNFSTSSVISYKLISGLTISTRLGFNKLETNEFTGTSILSQKPERRQTFIRTARYTSSDIKTVLAEPQINYKKTVASGTLDALIGATIQQNNNNGEVIGGSGYPTDALLKDIRSATSFNVTSSIDAVYKYNAVFGRLNYNWQEKYIININGRRDGSSRFGPRNKYHNFYSFGGAWIFTKENFLKRIGSFLSYGKLRASYGTSGNDQIGDYRYLDLYGSLNNPVPYQGWSSIVVNGIPNPYLQWEETKKLSFGLDLGALQDKIILSFNYSQNRSSNQLLSYSLPSIAGFPSVYANLPATIQNETLEFSINSINISSKNFEWKSSINLTIPKNKLLAFPNIENSTLARTLVVGKPLSIKQVFHFLGVDPATGYYEFADAKGQPTTTPDYLTDRVSLVNTDPKFYGGFQNSFRFKGFQLDGILQFVKQLQSSPDYYSFGTSNPPGTAFANQPVYVLNRWKKPGDNAIIQKYNSDFSAFDSYSNAVASDAAIVDASFIRLKNISVSYDLPVAIIQKMHMRNLKFYVAAQNLVTITNFKGIDPESQSNSSLPPLKTVVIGLNIGL